MTSLNCALCSHHLLALRNLDAVNAGTALSATCRILRPRTGEHEMTVRNLKDKYQ